MKNKRWIYLAITSAIIVLGLASRKHGDILPEFIAEYSGDTLWAAMVYCGIRFLFPSSSILKTIVISLLFSYCIEISQLYQADWANTYNRQIKKFPTEKQNVSLKHILT